MARSSADLAALIVERDEQIAYLADKVAEAEAEARQAAKAAPPLDPAVIKAAVDREVEKVKARLSAAAARTDATATRVEKTAGADPAVGGDGLLSEALGIARAEAQEAADAERGPKTPGYWKTALVALGARLAPDLPPNAQMNAALRSEEGRLLLASMDRNVGQDAKR
jgi:hypothetical protein